MTFLTDMKYRTQGRVGKQGEWVFGFNELGMDQNVLSALGSGCLELRRGLNWRFGKVNMVG